MEYLQLFYDRRGQPIDRTEAFDLMANPAYRRVAQTELRDGTWISTVWLGLDHSFGSGPPLIFETMVFANAHEYGEEWDMRRYATHDEAVQGHNEMVKTWRKKRRIEILKSVFRRNN